MNVNEVKKLKWTRFDEKRIGELKDDFLVHESRRHIEDQSDIINSKFGRKGNSIIKHTGVWHGEGLKSSYTIGLSDNTFDVCVSSGLLSRGIRSTSSLEEAINLCDDMNKWEVKRAYSELSKWIEG